MASELRYERTECERRFLVGPGTAWQSFRRPYCKLLSDRYLKGSRLRLRVMVDMPEQRIVYKLNKKAASDSPYCRTMSRILLAEHEYGLMASLPADILTKTRHYVDYNGRTGIASVDVFEGHLAGLVLCEIEAGNLLDLMAMPVPSFVIRDVTEDPFFDGSNLCRTKTAELHSRLELLRAHGS